MEYVGMTLSIFGLLCCLYALSLWRAARRQFYIKKAQNEMILEVCKGTQGRYVQDDFPDLSELQTSEELLRKISRGTKGRFL